MTATVTSPDRANLVAAPRATLYVLGMFGYSRIEARNLEVWIGRYAQYDRAVWCRFTRKGKRKPETVVQGYRPSLLVLIGDAHPEPPAPFTAPDDQGNTQSLYASCDERYRTDFDAAIDAYLAKRPGIVLADYRKGA